MNPAWLYLVLAAVAEAFYGIGVYHSRGFTILWPSALALVSAIATTLLLGLGMKQLPMGLSFAVWSGLATIGTTAYGIICLGEAKDLLRLGLIALIIVGILGLKLTASH